MGQAGTSSIYMALKGQCQGHSRFRRLISRKEAELGHVFLLNTNRKSHMGGPMTLSDPE